MKPNKNKLRNLLLSLIIVSFFVSPSTLAKKAILDPNQSEYYLKGSPEDIKDFNFNIAPGSSASDQITIINNTDNDITFALAGVDSETNNQGFIVFKNETDENRNIGQWLRLESNTITVKGKETASVPFNITVPADAFPGTYYGGISIQKKPSEVALDEAPSFVVKVQTRQVLGLIIDVPGSVEKTFEISDLKYDQLKSRYEFTVNNTGNALLSFEGELSITSNDLFHSQDDKLEITKFRILPQDSLTKIILYAPQPLFGEHKATLKGEISYFDGILNEDIALTTIEKTLQTNFFAWHIVLFAIGTLIVLVLGILTAILAEKRYLKNCTSYTVGQNESLEDIAHKFGMPWKKLAKINHLHAPYALKTDQKILVHESRTKKQS